MLQKQGYILLVGCLAIFLGSCNEYQNALKSTDIKEKYELAERYYNEGDFKRAQRLFEQIAPKYQGKPQGERVMFFLSSTQFKNRSYYLSGYSFERFLKSYPNSDKKQEAAFYTAKSYYMLSPKYSLDQTDTDKALSKLQDFINGFPESEYFNEANEMALELTRKKEQKTFEIAKQFDRLGEFNLPLLISSITAMDNFLIEHPGSEFREDAYYYKLKSATILALNSTIQKKEERINEAKEAHRLLFKYFPETKYSKEAQVHLESLEKEQELVTNLSK